MSRPGPYKDWLKQDLSQLIDVLNLTEMQKHFMHSRVLDQVLWMEGQADRYRNSYYLLRLTSIIGGVILPALVTLLIAGEFVSAVRWIAFTVSLIVGVSTAVEEFFHYGERWRHYRRTAEWLKIDCWNFLQLSGPFQEFKDHLTGYGTFAARVEDIMQRDIEAYVSYVAQEKAREPVTVA